MAKTYGKQTSTWKMFEALFIEAGGKTEQGEWIRLPCNSKGQAINLAIGMNTCNMQWHAEHGVDKKLNKISARPAEQPDGTWVIELTESKIHNRAQAKMANMLEQVLLMQNTGVLIKPRPEVLDPDEPGISPGEKIRRLAGQSPNQDTAIPSDTKPGQVPGLDPASRNMHNLDPVSSRTKGPVSDDLFASMFDLKLDKPKEKE